MGTFKLNQTFKKYAAFLQGVRFPIQETVVSQPVDLSNYVNSQKEVLKGVEGNKRRWLLERYIQYTERFERNQSIIKRQRYLMFSVPIKQDTERDFHNALQQIEDKTAEIERKFQQMELTATLATAHEIIKYLHTLYDYKTAQNLSLKSSEFQPIITGLTGGNE
jgi:hypothetical protein